MVKSFIGLLMIVAAGVMVLVNGPKATIKAPTQRYHGYELNRKAIQHTKELTVLISAEGWGGISRGTGVLIDANHILTCYHVAAARNESFWVYTYPEKEVYHAKPVYGSSIKDLAIMELDRPILSTPTPVFQDQVYDGEPITIIGNILGAMHWFVGYGIISGGSGPYLYTDGTQTHGDSGGPWINENGEIVALADWGLETENGNDTGIHGGVSAKEIKEFLKSWKEPSILDILLGGVS